MILKSFEIENNIKNIIKFNFILIYGENVGLKDVLKKKIISLYKDIEIINLYEEDITKNKDVIINEVKNVSLFASNKLIIINQINERILPDIEYLFENKGDVKIVLMADLLDKRSKIRNIFEKETDLAVIPCYHDNDITLRKIIQTELKDYKNLNSNTINMILNFSNSNRKTIINNLEKIKSFYEKKILSEESLEKLLNSDRNELFENIRDAALDGNEIKLNSLLNNYAFANEDAYLYLNSINFRLIKLLDIHNHNKSLNDLNLTISKFKPPIFWKDKPVFLNLLQKWDKQRVISALRYLGEIEKKIKSNTNLNNLTAIKNSITNICSNRWTYF